MKTMYIVGGLVLLALVLAGCGGAAEETAVPEVDDYVPAVSVTGEVVPAVWATVSARAEGTVLELLVEPGDVVAAGDVLVRLDPAGARLAVRQAESALEIAQAQLALLETGPRAEEIAIAEGELEAAEAALAQAVAQLDQFEAGVAEAEIAAARARVTTAEADRLAADEMHDQTMKCYTFTIPGEGEQMVCPLLGPAEEQARYSLQIANEELDAARAQLDALLAGADDRLLALDGAVAGAMAQRDIAQAELDLLRAGAAAEEIAASGAAVAQAQAALDAAQVALERTQVRSPIAGTVGLVWARSGELVVLGQPLVTVGDLGTLRVETTDLDEIDVGRVAVGQEVAVTIDAFPDQTFVGRIARISPMAESGGGGVNYTVIVELDEIPAAVRWGMTAFVDVEAE